MWARVVEIMFGFWLLASPFIFNEGEKTLASNLPCGLLVIILGFLSYWNRTQGAHLLTILVALWLIVLGYWTGYPAPPSAQNQIMVGLLLAMFAIIPNWTNDLPEDWKKFYGNGRYD